MPPLKQGTPRLAPRRSNQAAQAKVIDPSDATATAAGCKQALSPPPREPVPGLAEQVDRILRCPRAMLWLRERARNRAEAEARAGTFARVLLPSGNGGPMLLIGPLRQLEPEGSKWELMISRHGSEQSHALMLKTRDVMRIEWRTHLFTRIFPDWMPPLPPREMKKYFDDVLDLILLPQTKVVSEREQAGKDVRP
jgi:hypothetical protein